MKIGEKAPDFTLEASNDSKISLDHYKGKNIVFYFYPKDNTPGWINEANEFGELYDSFKEIDTEILGVSADSIASHKKFIEKQDIPFLLLSDNKKEVGNKYGVYKEKGIMAKIGLGAERATFVIDKDGKLIKEYRDVKVKGHARDVLDFLKNK